MQFINDMNFFLLRQYLQNCKPNLFLVGPPKSATTFLHKILIQSPEIFSTSHKELRFFSNIKKLRNPFSWRYYKKNFSHTSFLSKKYKYYLDSTPSYFEVIKNNGGFKHHNYRSKNVPSILKSVIGSKIKIIIVIRNPVLRSISHYFHHLKVGRLQKYNNGGIFEISKKYPETLTASNYENHIFNWEKYFNKQQILYINYEDIRKSSKKVLKKIENFLDVYIEKKMIDLTPVNEGFDLIRTNKGLQLNLNSISKSNSILNEENLDNLDNYVLSEKQRKEFSVENLKFFKEALISNNDLKNLIDLYKNDFFYLNKRFPEMAKELSAHELL